MNNGKGSLLRFHIHILAPSLYSSRAPTTVLYKCFGGIAFPVFWQQTTTVLFERSFAIVVASWCFLVIGIHPHLPAACQPCPQSPPGCPLPWPSPQLPRQHPADLLPYLCRTPPPPTVHPTSTAGQWQPAATRLWLPTTRSRRASTTAGPACPRPWFCQYLPRCEGMLLPVNGYGYARLCHKSCVAVANCRPPTIYENWYLWRAN